MDLVALGMIFIFLGFIVAFVGLALSMLVNGRRGGKGKVDGGGLIMIGPIPIMFGTNRKWIGLMAIIALALMALYILSMVGGRS